MSPQRILLVEDEESIRDLYARQLTKAGFNITPVGTGEAALDELKKAQFDILLLDIMLPGINGLQILREFKTMFPNSPAKAIMLTNLGQDTVIKEGFELGANAYLIKASFTPDQVVNEVKNVLAGGQPANPNPNTQPVIAPAGTPAVPTTQPPVQPAQTEPQTPPVTPEEKPIQ